MKKGFENRPSKPKEGVKDTEMIKSIKKAILQIEEELKKNNNTDDDILNLEKSLTELKIKLASFGGIKIEESIKDYHPSLEQVVYNRNLIELYQRITDINNEIIAIKSDRNVLDYIEKDNETLELENEIITLENEIKKGIEVESEIPKEKLIEMISKLKLYKEALNRKKEYLSRRFNEDISIPKAIYNIKKAEDRINLAIQKIKQLEDDHEKYSEEEEIAGDKKYDFSQN